MDRLKLKLEVESLEIETFDPREVEVVDYSWMPATTGGPYECDADCTLLSVEDTFCPFIRPSDGC